MAYIGKAPGFGIRNRFYFTATASQTSFSGSDDNGQTLKYADSKYLDVYLNGVSLVAGTDYTAATGTSVVLTTGASADDIVEIIAYDIFSIADTVSATQGGTFEGDVTVDADLTVSGFVGSSSTGSLELPAGTTAQRPSSPVEGMIRYNTDLDEAEGYQNGGWVALHRNPDRYSVSYLVIAGGGAGGAHGGSGGGAGGYRNSYASETSGGDSETETPATFTVDLVYTVNVGGGASGVVDASSSNGTESSIKGGGVDVVSIGGAGGVSGVRNPGAGRDGGSGSGGANGAGATLGGSGTAGQGSDGGDNSGSFGTGGGGGAGAVGASGSGVNAGNGGGGLSSSITGSAVTRAGGGGGSSQTGTHGSGGSGGGGAGANGSGGSGSANTGSGGGGTHNSTATSGSGGSGVVILRMATANYTGSVTGSPTVTTDGSDTILTFTSSGTYTA